MKDNELNKLIAAIESYSLEVEEPLIIDFSNKNLTDPELSRILDALEKNPVIQRNVAKLECAYNAIDTFDISARDFPNLEEIDLIGNKSLTTLRLPPKDKISKIKILYLDRDDGKYPVLSVLKEARELLGPTWYLTPSYNYREKNDLEHDDVALNDLALYTQAVQPDPFAILIANESVKNQKRRKVISLPGEEDDDEIEYVSLKKEKQRLIHPLKTNPNTKTISIHKLLAVNTQPLDQYERDVATAVASSLGNPPPLITKAFENFKLESISFAETWLKHLINSRDTDAATLKDLSKKFSAFIQESFPSESNIDLTITEGSTADSLCKFITDHIGQIAMRGILSPYGRRWDNDQSPAMMLEIISNVQVLLARRLEDLNDNATYIDNQHIDKDADYEYDDDENNYDNTGNYHTNKI